VTPEEKSRYRRQVDGWRCELKRLGHRLDAAINSDEVHHVSNHVSDLKVRVRRTCDELNLSTNGTESLDRLVSKIMKVIG
jgi:hypothetical protein